MKPVVPFIHQMNDKDAQVWLKTLQSAIPEINICPVKNLQKLQRENAEVAITANPSLTELQTLPNLKWIQSLWAGIDQLIDKSTDIKIPIVRLIDPQLSDTMSEAVLAWTLYLHREMPLYAKQQTEKIWKQHNLKKTSETTVGILGMGQLGQAAAKRLLDNGFNVLGWNRDRHIDDIKTFNGYEGLLKIANLSDILVILLPLTPQTDRLLGYEFFNHTKYGVSFINFARSGIVDTQAMVKNLDTGHIKHAVLDVFESEPLPATDPLWDNPNITILPHISAPTNKYTASHIIAENLKKYFNSAKIPQAVSRHRGY